MLASELLRSEVRTESGEKLGHVFDVRVARDPRSSSDRVDQKWRLTGLLVGRRGAGVRFGFAHGDPAKPLHRRDAVPWDAVVRVEEGRIVVRDDARAS